MRPHFCHPVLTLKSPMGKPVKNRYASRFEFAQTAFIFLRRFFHTSLFHSLTLKRSQYSDRQQSISSRNRVASIVVLAVLNEKRRSRRICHPPVVSPWCMMLHRMFT